MSDDLQTTEVPMRRKLYELLSSDSEIMSRLPGGLLQIGALEGTPVHKPFAIMRFSFTQGRIRDLTKVSYVAVWVHDVPGTYDTIDEILTLVRQRMVHADPDRNFLEARWLEDSIDFRDDDQGTIVRYSRFQMFHTTRGG